MSGRPTTPRDVVAQGAIDDAKNGRIPRIGEYTLRQSSKAFRTTVPMMVCRNLDVKDGSVADVYADFEQGLLVYDIQQSDEEVGVEHGE